MVTNNAKSTLMVKNELVNDTDQTKLIELIKIRLYRAREIITDTIISVQLYRKIQYI